MNFYVESKKVYLVEISNRIEVTRGRTIRKGGEEVGQQIKYCTWNQSYIFILSKERGLNVPNGKT